MANKSPVLSIGQLARRVGARPSTLRYYERIGVLPSPSRSAGQRRYAEDMVDRLRLIGFAKRAGFRLAEIRSLLGAERKQGKPASVASGWRQIIPAKIVELEKEMARLQEARLRLRSLMSCRCHQPEECGKRLQGSEDSLPPPHGMDRTYRHGDTAP